MGAGGLELYRLKNQTQQLDPTGTYTAGIDPMKEHELLRNILQSLQQQPVIPPIQPRPGVPSFQPIAPNQPGQPGQPGLVQAPPRPQRFPVYSPMPTGPMSQMAYRMAMPTNPLDILRTIQPAPRSP